LRNLLVSDVSVADVIGGAERVLYEQGTRLAQRGHLVHILTRRLEKHRNNCAQIADLVEWRYPLDRRNAIAYLWSTRQNAMRLFAKLQHQYRYDRIHFHQPFSAFGVNACPIAKPIRKIYTCHSLAFEEYSSRNAKPSTGMDKILHGFHILVRRWLEKGALEQADRIIVLSDYTKAKLVHTYGLPKSKISVIAGGTDMDQFSPAKDKQAIRKRLKLPANKTILFTVRNLVPRMGLEALLLAFTKVLRKVAGVHLVIGGEGKLMASLQTLASGLGISEQVTFTGFIPDDQLADYYRMANLFVLPTKELEGFGLVTVEAMASGVPVVGTPVGGTQEILSRFDSSLLFQDNTPDAMAQLILEKVQTIQKSPTEWHRVSIACRHYAENRYSWEQNLDALEKLMHS